MLIAVYGTLRKCGALHGWLADEEKVKYLGKDKLVGFGLYIYAGLPMVDWDEGEIVVEVYDVHPEIFVSIDAMERGAGYRPIRVYTKYGWATMWINHEAKKGRKVEGGDYCGGN